MGSIIKILFSLLIAMASIQANATTNIDTTCNISTIAEPQYQVSFILPKSTDSSIKLVVRMYQPWGDGSSTGWQELLQTPSASLNGEPLTLVPAFSYQNQTNFQTGALSLGTDEYAQYFIISIPATTTVGEKLIITGDYQQVAYMSATVYNYSGTADGFKWQSEKFDYEFSALDNACNPYITSNPSVFAYTTGIPNNTLTSITNTQSIKKISLPKVTTTNTNSGSIGVYRLDKFDSRNVMADDIANDGCSKAYLFAQKSSTNQEVLVMRVKIPTTFIANDTPDTIFGDYQVRYFSISANVDPALHSSNPLSFWTVNSRMLAQYADKDGYAYVFFAPNDYVSTVVAQQGTITTQPPVITWGKYQGYLLGDPDFAIVMRYKAPNSTWSGSPEHAVCYTTPNQLKPLSNYELGTYTPEVYADTMDNFMNGNIGAVNMNNIWPIAR